MRVSRIECDDCFVYSLRKNYFIMKFGFKETGDSSGNGRSTWVCTCCALFFVCYVNLHFSDVAAFPAYLVYIFSTSLEGFFKNYCQKVYQSPIRAFFKDEKKKI